jgi:hypothetical protein
MQEETEGRRIFFNDSSLASSHAKAKLLEIMFERFGFDGVRVESSAVLALYSQGMLLLTRSIFSVHAESVCAEQAANLNQAGACHLCLSSVYEIPSTCEHIAMEASAFRNGPLNIPNAHERVQVFFCVFLCGLASCVNDFSPAGPVVSAFVMNDCIKG